MCADQPRKPIKKNLLTVSHPSCTVRGVKTTPNERAYRPPMKTCKQKIATPAEIPEGAFPYRVMYEAVLRNSDHCKDCGGRHIGDKEAGQRFGVSERQIRNARFSG